MSQNKDVNSIALIGNPNSGKTSLFNSLTGLQQHVANFPGVTVDKKTSTLRLSNGKKILITDFPGTYSLYPNSEEEKIVAEILCNPCNDDFPDAVIYVMDPFDFKRQSLLLTQLKDLNIPVLVALTKKDVASDKNIEVDLEFLKKYFGCDVVFCSNKSKENIDELKSSIETILEIPQPERSFYNFREDENKIVSEYKKITQNHNDYQCLLQIQHHSWLKFLEKDDIKQIDDLIFRNNFNRIRHQISETLSRFKIIEKDINKIIRIKDKNLHLITEKIDNVLTNRFIGPVIFFIIMTMVFQAVFSWANLPMSLIENGFLFLSSYIKNNLPYNLFTHLLADGIMPGLAGVMVFIPQIFILFLIIGIMEETGYMSRVIYMFDDIMQRFGMNGRSLISLISGGACAVPAIMSTRTIGNWKERLITIMVTPLISCSARLPVYSLLIVFAVPDKHVGIFNMRGLTIMGLYSLGIFTAFGSALVMKYLFKSKGSSYLVISMPDYNIPSFKNIALYLKEKLSAFIFGAGKIIVILSIVLWFLASYGIPSQMRDAKKDALKIAAENNLSEIETSNLISYKKLESSFIGQLGKIIEPTIRPLGFDWKIGIAIISSFAAREVFVGTMATIYSIESAEDNVKISERMKNEIDPLTKKPTYTPAVAWSLLIFYVFALQCISTLAVVHRETNSITWPLIQFVYMGTLAYILSYTVFNFLK